MINEIIVVCFFVFITGACIGSFLNVVALRAISKESIIFPASKCPTCNTPIKWYDNIPIISYFLTFKGKCRNCGCKVSIQYPIVEAFTAILFVAVFLIFGLSIKTILLLIWLCTAIVITITDIKEQSTYNTHLWVLIIISIITSLYLNGIQNYTMPLIGLIAGVVIMELIARLAYYLVRKDEKKDEQKAENNETSENTEILEQNQNNEAQDDENSDNREIEENSENFDINEYVKKKKRAFGEGDTYIAAASGALLGWLYIFVAIPLAILIQAICILPQFIKRLYDKSEFRLLFSLSAFFFIAVLYWLLNSLYSLNLFVLIGFVILLIFFAIDTITRLKKTVNEEGFSAIPFGPSLLISTVITFMFGKYITSFLINHVFMLMG